MNEMKVFENSEFGNLTVIEKDGEPWFIAKEIADILGYNQTSDMTKRLDKYEKADQLLRMVSSNQHRKQTIINESGLYEAIFGSKKENAKDFKKWIKREILPSIRKTGKYEIKKALPDFNDPIEAAEAWLKEAKTKKLLAEKLESEKDKIEFYNAVADTKGADPMGKVAKVLDLGIGRNQLFSFLRNNGILMDDNEPYQRYMTSGYFKVVMYKYESSGNIITHYKTLVTKKGVNFILKKYLEKYPECSKSDVDQIIQKATNMTVNETTDNKEI